ncbi:hypothetical protein GOV09_04255, partial [Candidatus Woesearchaeota archaeon]|nr:hypothetical protein [Candidatus Woesearchaeota archaeon]
TYFHLTNISDIHFIESFPKEFVLKPNRGFGGNGIMILHKEGDSFTTLTGEVSSLHAIKMHIEKILDGQFAEYAEDDSVLVEERINPSKKLMFKGIVGVPDIRIVCINAKAAFCMIRLPTLISGGKANLSSGAIGLAVDISTGTMYKAYSKFAKKYISLKALGISNGQKLPKWKKIMKLAEYVAYYSELRFTGIDIVLDKNENLLVFEANGYPGLEIQNVTGCSITEWIAHAFN